MCELHQQQRHVRLRRLPPRRLLREELSGVLLQAAHAAVAWAKCAMAHGSAGSQVAHWKEGHKQCCKMAMHEVLALGAKLSRENDALLDRKDWEKLMPQQFRLYHLAQMIGLQQERVACHSLCTVHNGLGDYRTALRYGEREELLARRLDDKSLIAGALESQMLAHSSMNDGEKSVELAELILAYIDEHASALEMADRNNTKRNIATIFNRFQRFERACAIYNTMPGSQQSREEEGTDLLTRGNTLAQMGDIAGARRAFEQSLAAHPMAITFKSLADVAWSEDDAHGRTIMLQAAFRLAVDPSRHRETQLQQKVVILAAYHNDLAVHGKHVEAADVRRQLSPLLEAQSCTGAFPSECVVCHEELDAHAGCWVLQVCRHLMHSDCLKQTIRAQWPRPCCPVGRCQLSASDLMRLGVIDRTNALI
jgi:tetratricopeptide (TPR) repeat protein